MVNPSPAASAPRPRGSRDAVHLEAGRTRFAAEWLGDRWRHSVTVDGVLVAESMEGEEGGHDPRWPASPAIVELSRIEAAGCPVIVGVGLAGRSHFSLSVAAHPTRPDTLLFEAACRVVEPAPWLGSQYRRAAGKPPARIAAAAATPPATVQWAYHIGPHGIEAAG